jgi:mRNA interferase HigB
MRVISNKALVAFAQHHPTADEPLRAWRPAIESRPFANFADIKSTFRATDRVGDVLVFNIGGNKYRLIAFVNFNRQLLYVRHILPHREYDKWKP